MPSMKVSNAYIDTLSMETHNSFFILVYSFYVQA